MTQDNFITSLQHTQKKYPPLTAIQKKAHIPSFDVYQKMYAASLKDPHSFWLEQAKRLHWFQFPNESLKYTWDVDKRIVEHTWFENGTLNLTYNCLDRHVVQGHGKDVAIIWQGEKEDEVVTLTYDTLLKKVCQCTNYLLSLGVAPGDRVCIYLPMIPEAVITMLSCARIGAIHSVVLEVLVLNRFVAAFKIQPVKS